MITVGSDWDLDVFVPGQPRPQGSKRALGRGRMVESSIHVGAWRDRVGYHAMQARTGQPPIDRLIPVRLVLVFVMPRPASAPKKTTPAAIRQPDLDKLIRAVGDSLSGVIYSDDAQVVQIHATKRVAGLDETAGVHIRVGRAA